MTPDDSDLHTLVGAYVLDAVSPDEHARFSAHLAWCSACRAEISELREAAASLGTTQAVRPRPELRAATIAAAELTGQLAPVIAGKDIQTGQDRATRRSRAIRWVSAAAAVVVVAAGVAVGTHVVDMRARDSGSASRVVTDVLLAPDAVMRSAPVRTGGMAIVVASRHKHMAVFIAHGLQSLPRTRRYELWLMGPRGERPAGLLAVHPGGMAGPAVISGMSQGDMVGLTVEPASGSLKPTSPPVLMISPQGH
jgi:anti-sigma-K factor RskA